LKDGKSMSETILQHEVLVAFTGGFVKAKLGMIVALKALEDIPRDGYYNKHLSMLKESPGAKYKIIGISSIEPKFLDLTLSEGCDLVSTRLPAIHVIYVAS